MDDISNLRVGDVVLIPEGLGIIRYVGEIENRNMAGIEIKDPPNYEGTNGTYNNTTYFDHDTNNCIFTDSIQSHIRSKDLLDKVAKLYNILNGSVENTKFVSRSQYNEISQKLMDSNVEINKLKDEVDFLKQQCQEKINENSLLHQKLNKWADELHMRRPTLSSIDQHTLKKINDVLDNTELERMKQEMENENNENNSNGYQPPEIGYQPPYQSRFEDKNDDVNDIENDPDNNNKTKKVRKSRESMTLDSMELGNGTTKEPKRRGTKTIEVNDLPDNDDNNSNNDDDGLPNNKSRKARDSMEVSSNYVEENILPDNNNRKQKSRDSMVMNDKQVKQHTRNQSSIDIMNQMGDDWQKDIYVRGTENDKNNNDDNDNTENKSKSHRRNRSSVEIEKMDPKYKDVFNNQNPQSQLP